MGRPGKRHLLDPFRVTDMLCGLARVHHEHTVGLTDLDVCLRCNHRAQEIAGVVARATDLGTLDFPCTSCGARPGDLCLDTERRPAIGHMPRMTIARWRREDDEGARDLGWVQRQRELALVLDEDPVQDARSSDRPLAPPDGEATP